MKHSLIPIFFILVVSIAVPCSAQWQNTGQYGANGYVAIFGVHDNNLFISDVAENGGIAGSLIRYIAPYSWVRTETGIDWSQGIITSFASLGKYFFAGMTYYRNGNPDGPGPAWVSSDSGAHWISSGTASPVASNGEYLFAQYVAPSQIVRSTDIGENWEVKANLAVSSFAVIGINIFANTGSALWRSTDTGNSWSQLSPPFTGTMTVMDSLLFIVSSTGQLAESTDSGSDWTTIPVDTAGVPIKVNVLATDGKNLFAGTPAGLLVSTDIGQDWTPQNYGLDYDYVFGGGFHLSYNIDAIVVFDTLLFADVQYSNGTGYLSYRPISEMTAKAAVQEVSLLSDSLMIYPNPASGLITILAGGTNILGVSVLNVLGSETGAGFRGPGSGKVDLDLSKLPSGTYFLQIETAKGTVMRKVVRE
jgi:hypothetical protein